MVGSSSRAVITMIGTWLAARIIEISGQAVDVGQPEVEQHDLGPSRSTCSSPARPVAARGDRVAALGQAALHRGADRRVVLDHQDAGHARTVAPGRPGRGCGG